MAGELGACPSRPSRVSPRRASYFSLLRQRNLTKRKASRSQGRCAVPCAARVKRGLARTRFAQTIASPDPLAPALLSPATRRGERSTGTGSGTRFARSADLVCVFSSPSAPFWLGRAAQMEAGSGPQLFERSEFCGPPPESSSAGCPKRSVGTQTAGRLSFAYFSLAKQRKVSSRRATPGQQLSAKSTAPGALSC